MPDRPLAGLLDGDDVAPDGDGEIPVGADPDRDGDVGCVVPEPGDDGWGADGARVAVVEGLGTGFAVGLSSFGRDDLRSPRGRVPSASVNSGAVPGLAPVVIAAGPHTRDGADGSLLFCAPDNFTQEVDRVFLDGPVAGVFGADATDPGLASVTGRPVGSARGGKATAFPRVDGFAAGAAIATGLDCGRDTDARGCTSGVIGRAACSTTLDPKPPAV